MEPSSPSPGVATDPAGLTLASIGARAGAWIIDQVLVAIPFGIAILVYAVVTDGIDLLSPSATSTEESAEAGPFWVAFIPIAMRIVYDAVLVAWQGRTVGMMALKIEVQSVAGGRLEWWQACIRALVVGVAWSVPVVGPFLVIGVYLSASFDEHRRGLHDRAAGSLVVQTPRPPPFVAPLGFSGWYPGAMPPPPPPSSRRPPPPDPSPDQPSPGAPDTEPVDHDQLAIVLPG